MCTQCTPAFLGLLWIPIRLREAAVVERDRLASAPDNLSSEFRALAHSTSWTTAESRQLLGALYILAETDAKAAASSQNHRTGCLLNHVVWSIGPKHRSSVRI